MATPYETLIRESLSSRQRRLETALRDAGPRAELLRLLGEVDAALQRIDGGTFGQCDVCHDPIEADRLLVDPLLHTCLDHLTPLEQQALEQDLDLAKRIQETLLPPRDFALAGWDAAWHYEPLRTVSGDYCDLIAPPGGEGDGIFLVGDVAGKGLSASLLMSRLHAIFRSLVELRLPLPGLMGKANTLFCNSILSEQYATLLCGRAATGGRVELCNAGHAPVLARRGDRVQEVRSTGLPLGLFCSSEYAATTLDLGPGDVLLVCTDGLTESRNSDRMEYGAHRLRSLLDEGAWRDARELVQSCLSDVTAFRSGAPRGDDLTILALRYTPA